MREALARAAIQAAVTVGAAQMSLIMRRLGEFGSRFVGKVSRQLHIRWSGSIRSLSTAALDSSPGLTSTTELKTDD